MAANHGRRTRPSTLVGTWLGSGLVLDIGSYESIASTTVGSGGSATVEFTSIPNIYKHLQIRGIARSTATGSTQDTIRIRFNSDSGTNYSAHAMGGDGSVAYVAQAAASQTNCYTTNIPRAGVTASVYGGFVYDILDYLDTNKYKTIRTIGGADQNGSGTIIMGGAAWRSTNAITSILLYPDGSGASFAQYSHFALYGIKG